MNVYEVLSFNFKEFVTSPSGILIIVGIVCLIIGIILSIKEGKKKPDTPVKVEDNKTEEKKEENKVEEVVPTTPVEEKTETKVDSSPVVAPVVEAPTTPAPLEMPTTPVAPIEMPTMPEAIEMPTMPEAIEMPTMPAVEAAPVVESAPATEPVIYGGANPEVVKNEVVEEKPREIYGGANPLENTAPIPPVVVRGTYTEPAPVAETKEEVPVPATEEKPAEEPAPAPVTEEKPAEEEIEKLEF